MKIIKYMIKYFIGPVPVGSECILRMSTCVVWQITSEKASMHRLLESLTAAVPRCWLTYTTGVSVGKGIMTLCGLLYIKLYISSKTQSQVMMDEVA